MWWRNKSKTICTMFWRAFLPILKFTGQRGCMGRVLLHAEICWIQNQSMQPADVITGRQSCNVSCAFSGWKKCKIFFTAAASRLLDKQALQCTTLSPTFVISYSYHSILEQYFFHLLLDQESNDPKEISCKNCDKKERLELDILESSLPCLH